MNTFLEDVLLLIYNVIFYIMDGINSIFFPDGWIKFITIPFLITGVSLTMKKIVNETIDRKEIIINGRRK